MQASFNISIGLEDSVSYYTIHYIDSATDVVCASATVPSSSCVNGLCKHSLEVPSSSCSSSLSITVTVSGTNVLGKGLPSLPVYALNYLGKCQVFFPSTTFSTRKIRYRVACTTYTNYYGDNAKYTIMAIDTNSLLSTMATAGLLNQRRKLVLRHRFQDMSFL